jgi:hypothetical protein
VKDEEEDLMTEGNAIDEAIRIVEEAIRIVEEIGEGEQLSKDAIAAVRWWAKQIRIATMGEVMAFLAGYEYGREAGIDMGSND